MAVLSVLIKEEYLFLLLEIGALQAYVLLPLLVLMYRQLTLVI